MNLPKGAAIRLTIIFIFLGIGGAYSWEILLNPDSLEQVEAQAKLLEQIYVNGNYIESFLWFCFAIGFAVNAGKTSGRTRIHRLITTLIFLLFGGSDIVEVQTGAWWSPWWLFVWKASCVLSMVILLWVYLRDRPLANKP
jgi:phosphotransferase system  glucose/maltose/N-acetylglucosamine-specific IIC component